MMPDAPTTIQWLDTRVRNRFEPFLLLLSLHFARPVETSNGRVVEFRLLTTRDQTSRKSFVLHRGVHVMRTTRGHSPPTIRDVVSSSSYFSVLLAIPGPPLGAGGVLESSELLRLSSLLHAWSTS